jgi:predicted PurR-regulated permease PerM
MAVFYMPFLIAFIISLMVEPAIKLFSKKTKIQRKPSAIIVLALVFAVIVGLLVWGITVLIDEGANLLKMINDSVRRRLSVLLWELLIK